MGRAIFGCLATSNRVSCNDCTCICIVPSLFVQHSLKDSDSPQRARLAAIFKDASQNVKSVLLCSSCFSAANLVPGLT